MAVDAAVETSARFIKQAPEPIHLRPSTAADYADLFSIFASTRANEFAHLEGEQERIAALIADQFRLQDTYYHRHYSNAHFDMVMCEGIVIGRLYHNWSEDTLRIIDIALLPEWRGRRIGTRLMHALVSVATQRGMAVSLYVEMNNPVCALYERLGFRAIGDEGVYQLMQRSADTACLVNLPIQESLNELFR